MASRAAAAWSGCWPSMTSRLPPRPWVRPATPGHPYGRRALLDEVAAVATAPEGTRNQLLWRSARSLYRLVASGVLDQAAAERALHDAAAECGLLADEPHATERTLQSARRSAWHSPGESPWHLAAGRPGHGGQPGSRAEPGAPRAGAALGDGSQLQTETRRFGRSRVWIAAGAGHWADLAFQHSPRALTTRPVRPEAQVPTALWPGLLHRAGHLLKRRTGPPTRRNRRVVPGHLPATGSVRAGVPRRRDLYRRAP
jgi:hypothetical protein